jgi:hypothetical protein
MTKREREQVVVVLKAAAVSTLTTDEATRALELGDRIRHLADKAFSDCMRRVRTRGPCGDEMYNKVSRRAAVRVEKGWTP